MSRLTGRRKRLDNVKVRTTNRQPTREMAPQMRIATAIEWSWSMVSDILVVMRRRSLAGKEYKQAKAARQEGTRAKI